MTHCKGKHGRDFKEDLMKVLSEKEASNEPPIISLRSQKKRPKITKTKLQKKDNEISLPKIKNLIASNNLVGKEFLGPLAVAAEVSITTSATK